MSKKRLHLIAKAHLDPVWLWRWEEGAAEALSTFRSAADFLDAYPDFVFCHNESILYRWVEEYEPSLFKRIQKLVKAKRWHIMGGWFIQPDCNIPSGESFVRQALLGKLYFKQKFGVDVPTAANFDSFGHSRGLVQIMAKSGTDSYLFSRPCQQDHSLPDDAFVWVGYDGSEIIGYRLWQGYNGLRGQARSKVEQHLKERGDRTVSAVTWGIGDHGGGPSREDLDALGALIQETEDFDIFHSTPTRYFKELSRKKGKLVRHPQDLNMWAPGCYTSHIRIKQKHRQLENELYSAEKMISAAWLQGLMDYPHKELREATEDLLFSEFHDIMGGTCIQPAEDDAIRMLEHGLEILTRQKMRAMVALTSGQPRVKDGEQPLFVFNPHPYKIHALIEGEFNLPDQNWKIPSFQMPVITRDGQPVRSQPERECSTLLLDWRKKVVIDTELEPNSIHRFDCRYELLEAGKPAPTLKAHKGRIRFDNGTMEVVINTHTGLIDRYRVAGIDYLQKNTFCPLVITDDADPWGSNVHGFKNVAGAFSLMRGAAAKRFSGVQADLPSVRVVEDGPVRSIVEAIFGYGDSFICQRYKLPKQGTEFEIETRVYWNEKDKMLKLSIPSADRGVKPIGQVAYGINDLLTNGDESVSQKWLALISSKTPHALTCVNDGIYGSSFEKGELRLSLLRSSAYSALPVGQPPWVPQDRLSPRADQGERVFRFWVNAGKKSERLDSIDREALTHNEKPYFLALCPCGQGNLPKTGIALSDTVIQLGTFKKSEAGQDLIIRLFEPTGKKRSTTLSLPSLGLKKQVTLTPFEIQTWRLNPRTRKMIKTNLLEKATNQK